MKKTKAWCLKNTLNDYLLPVTTRDSEADVFSDYESYIRVHGIHKVVQVEITEIHGSGDSE